MGRRKKQVKQRGRVDRRELVAFYLQYFDENQRRHGAGKAAAAHFGVSPATISYHMQRLGDGFWVLYYRGIRKHRRKTRKRKIIDRSSLVHFFETFPLRNESTKGMKAQAARHFGVRPQTIQYHIRMIKNDPDVPEEVKKLL